MTIKMSHHCQSLSGDEDKLSFASKHPPLNAHTRLVMERTNGANGYYAHRVMWNVIPILVGKFCFAMDLVLGVARPYYKQLYSPTSKATASSTKGAVYRALRAEGGSKQTLDPRCDAWFTWPDHMPPIIQAIRVCVCVRSILCFKGKQTPCGWLFV